MRGGRTCEWSETSSATTWRRCGMFLVGLVLSWGARARAETPPIDLDKPSADPYDIPIADVIEARKIVLRFSGIAPSGGTIEIYDDDDILSTRHGKACRLSVDASGTYGFTYEDALLLDKRQRSSKTRCADLFRPKGGTWYVSRDDSLQHARVQVVSPPIHSNIPTSIIKKRKERGAFEWPIPLATLAIAGQPAPQERCFFHLGRWIVTDCAKPEIDANGAELLWSTPAGKGPVLVLESGGAFWEVPTELKDPDPPQQPVGAALENLTGLCTQEVQADFGSRAKDGDEIYVICASAIGAPRIETWKYTCKKKEGDAALDCSEHRDPGLKIPARRPVITNVWAKDSQKVAISFEHEGLATTLYVPKKTTEGAELSDRGAEKEETAVFKRTFVGFVEDGALTITVEAGGSSNSTTIATIVQGYHVENSYWTALHFGLALGWTPGAKEVGVRTTPTGRYIDVVDEGGRPGMHLDVSYAYFPLQMPAEGDARCVLSFHLGVVGTNGNKIVGLPYAALGGGVAFTPEIALEGMVGVAQHEYPKTADPPGTPYFGTGESPPTETGVTPIFGVIFSFTPTLLRAAGLQVNNY